MDTVFKKISYDMKIVDKGVGISLKSNLQDIYLKHKNDEHHDEFDLTGITENDIGYVKNNIFLMITKLIKEICQ